VTSLAWFSPWPPQSTGVAGRSAEVVPLLAARGYAIDVFVDERDTAIARHLTRAGNEGPRPEIVRVQGAHDFVWRRRRGQYDLTVYQLGNSPAHEFVWPYLLQFPGLVVLHDARLHHARGRALLGRRRFDDYRAEFAWNHPGVSPDAAELGVKGFAGPYYYDWPMRRAVVEAARVTACHAPGAARILQAEHPDRHIETIALGEGRHESLAAEAERFRRDHRIDPHALVFGVHGALTAEKRVPEILEACAATRSSMTNARLLLAGSADPALDLDARIGALGLGDAVVRVDRPSDAEFDAAIAATDVSLNLRWPSALETSGPWVRSLAAGRASVIIDLAHQSHLPVLDPRTGRRHAPCEDLGPDADGRAIAFAVDILDEDHSLRLAMRRLSRDESLRRRLGLAARRFWEAGHTVERMREDYERVIARALATPDPAPALPAHMRPDPLSFPRRLLDSFGAGIARSTLEELSQSSSK
jgi:glycosyltransferase involved in cell wall biosynthesis